VGLTSQRSRTSTSEKKLTPGPNPPRTGEERDFDKGTMGVDSHLELGRERIWLQGLYPPAPADTAKRDHAQQPDEERAGNGRFHR